MDEVRKVASPRLLNGPLGSDPDRIVPLDSLRGLAVLGILLMNVQSFSMPEAAYWNPTAYGRLDSIQGWIWLASHVLADRKFMAIFSMLFGAGILLFCRRAEARGQPARRLHYSRMFWLLLFGLAHAYFLWYGDILVAYAICGMLLYPLRRWRPRRQLVAGIAFMSVAPLLATLSGLSVPEWPEAERAAIEETYWAPSPERIAEEIAAYRGGWLDQMSERVPVAWAIQTEYFVSYELWRVGGLMLIGMALLQWGILAGRRPPRFYLFWIVLGIGVALPATLYGVYMNQRHAWEFEYSAFFGWQFNYWASIPTALSWASLVLLASRKPDSFVNRLLAPVGRMAFTNYILQTILCTTIFYGHGAGLFGAVDRVGQLLIVLAVWCVCILLSATWMRRHRFGPLEWLWRRLTYGTLSSPSRNAAESG